MEGLLDSLGDFSVTKTTNNTYAEHPRFAQYKQKETGSSQNARRQAILNRRDKSRYDLLCHLRTIDEDDLTESEDEESMDLEEVEKVYRRPRKFKNFLMLNEWLVDVPADFEKEYLMMPCPVGKRALVVAHRKTTKAFNRRGIQMRRFPSLLPSGSSASSNTNRGSHTILDCIWCEAKRTFYVIDLIAWKDQSFVDCGTEFRWSFLHSKLNEDVPEVFEHGRVNPLKFELLPYVECSKASLTECLKTPVGGMSSELDGLLFYHKQSHYTHGVTPLVNWLKGYMVPEILGIPVCEEYINLRPSYYSTLTDHLAYKEEKRQQAIAKSQSEKQANGNKMDAVTEEAADPTSETPKNEDVAASNMQT